METGIKIFPITVQLFYDLVLSSSPPISGLVPEACADFGCGQRIELLIKEVRSCAEPVLAYLAGNPCKRLLQMCGQAVHNDRSLDGFDTEPRRLAARTQQGPQDRAGWALTASWHAVPLLSIPSYLQGNAFSIPGIKDLRSTLK